MRSHRSGADGVVGIAEIFRNAFFEQVPCLTTPSAPSKEASRLLLDVASTPHAPGGNWQLREFINSSLAAREAMRLKVADGRVSQHRTGAV